MKLFHQNGSRPFALKFYEAGLSRRRYFSAYDDDGSMNFGFDCGCGDKSPNNNDGHCKKANEVSETLKILNHNHYFLENRQEELMCIGKQRKTTF